MTTRRGSAVLKTLRRLPRHQHVSELSFTYEGSDQVLRIHPPNINSRGMFINTGIMFPEGSVLKLTFRLARTGVKIAARCEVRYCMPGVGMGVEFVNLPPECAHAIDIEMGKKSRTDRHLPCAKRHRSGK
jgi:hypothetical protein